MLSADDKLAEIKRLYYSTTAKTIQADLARALDLLSREQRRRTQRAAVYMDRLGRCSRTGDAGEEEVRTQVRTSN
jgi:hypothetical protein